jgi:hypothetical protein
MNDSGPGLFEAVIESWRLVFGNLRELLRIALLPFLLFMILHRLQQVVMPDEGLVILAWTLLFTILAGVPATILLMPWLRRLLAAADPELASRQPASGWSLVLMLRWIGLDVMFLMALAPISAMEIQAQLASGSEPAEPTIAAFLFIPIFVFSSYLIYGRMGLSLPAAASESDHRYRRSWQSTTQTGWRIGFAVVLCWLSVQIPVDVARASLASSDPSMAAQVLDAALAALFRTVNELLSAAVYVQFYIALQVRPMKGEW